MSVLGDLWVKLGLKKEGFDSGMKDAEKQTSSLGSKVKQMGAGMKAAWTAIGAIVAGKAAQMVTDMAKVAAQAEGIKTAFAKIADKNILDGLREATRNTVSDVTLMQKTIQASNFGIPIEQLATYFKFATERAIQTGESVDYLVDSIVTGLGRKSVMILDNLGISAADIRQEMEKGGDMAQAVGTIIQREMEKAGKVGSTTAVTFQQTQAAWENFKVSVGNSQIIQKTLSALAKGAAELLDTLNKIGEAGGISAYNVSQGIAEELDFLRAEGWSDSALVDLMRKKASQYENLGPQYLTSLTGKENFLNKSGTVNESKAQNYYEQLIKAANQLEAEQNKVTDAVKKTGTALSDDTEVIKGAIPLLEEQIEKLNEKKQTLTDINEIAATNTQIEALENELDNLKQINEEYLKQRDTIIELNRTKSALSLGGYATTDDGLSEAARDYYDAQIAAGEEAAAAFLAQNEMIEQAALALQNGITSGMVSSLDYLADAMAGVEDMDAGKMMQSLLDPLANAVISAGILIMTTGEGIEALKTSLISFFGGSAIAAGAALVALGTAAKVGLAALANGSNKTSSNTTSSYNWTGGYSTSSVAAAESSASIDVNVTGKISGQDIVLASEKYNNNKRR